MLYFDVTMPAVLFAVTLVTILLDRRVEGKLKTSFEKKEFHTPDAILFAAMITAVVSAIVFAPQMTIMIIFLFSYSTLLFTFSYVFSDMQKKKAQLFCMAFIVASVLAGAAGFFGLFPENVRFFGTVTFAGLAVCAFFALMYEHYGFDVKERWYLAVLPPALFVLLYLVYNGTGLWFPYLFNAYGVIFAVLVTLYLGSLFTWKGMLIFAGLLTIMDIILVLFTGVMMTAVKQTLGLGLPVLIQLPAIVTPEGLLPIGLGLGDFFFAGILAIQTFKKFDRKTAILSALAMSTAFAIFEVFLLNTSFFEEGFPGTLMIICGWLPLVAWKILSDRKQKQQ